MGSSTTNVAPLPGFHSETDLERSVFLFGQTLSSLKGLPWGYDDGLLLFGAMPGQRRTSERVRGHEAERGDQFPYRQGVLWEKE